MKKLLAILSSFAIATSSIVTVVSCSPNITDQIDPKDKEYLDYDALLVLKELQRVAETHDPYYDNLNNLIELLDKGIVILNEIYLESTSHSFRNYLTIILNKYYNLLSEQEENYYEIYIKEVNKIGYENRVRFSDPLFNSLLVEYSKYKNMEFDYYLNKYQSSVIKINSDLTTKYYLKNQEEQKIRDLETKISQTSQLNAEIKELKDINNEIYDVILRLKDLIEGNWNRYGDYHDNAKWYADRPGLAWIPIYGKYNFKKFDQAMQDMIKYIEILIQVFENKDEENSDIQEMDSDIAKAHKAMNTLIQGSIDLQGIEELMSKIDVIFAITDGIAMAVTVACSALGFPGVGLALALLTGYFGNISATYKMSNTFYEFDNDYGKDLNEARKESTDLINEVAENQKILLEQINDSYNLYSNQIEEWQKELKETQDSFNELNNEIDKLVKQKERLDNKFIQDQNILMDKGYKYFLISNDLISQEEIKKTSKKYDKNVSLEEIKYNKKILLEQIQNQFIKAGFQGDKTAELFLERLLKDDEIINSIIF